MNRIHFFEIRSIRIRFEGKYRNIEQVAMNTWYIDTLYNVRSSGMEPSTKVEIQFSFLYLKLTQYSIIMLTIILSCILNIFSRIVPFN